MTNRGSICHLNPCSGSSGIVLRQAPSQSRRSKDLMTHQIQILRSAEDRIDSLLSDITGTLQAELFDDELAAASALLKHGHLRAAGAVSGIVIERHLARTAENHRLKLWKKSPTVVDLNNP
jgi:uncharacterized protein YjcR